MGKSRDKRGTVEKSTGRLTGEDQDQDATAVALKRVIAWQITEEMKAQQITKTELAKRMHTSRAALNGLLDQADPSITLTTLESAAAALGQKVTLKAE